MTSQNPKSAAKRVMALPSKDYGATAPTTSEAAKIDTKGFRWATFILVGGAITGTTLAWKITESSDNFGSDTAADVTGAAGTNLASADDNEVHTIVVDLSKTERYLQAAFTFTSVTVSNIACVCVLSGAADSTYIGTAGNDASVDALAPA
jgi:hypothetical protein